MIAVVQASFLLTLILAAAGAFMTFLVSFLIYKFIALISDMINKVQIADSNVILRQAISDYEKGAAATLAQRKMHEDETTALQTTATKVQETLQSLQQLNTRLEETVARLTIENYDLTKRVSQLERDAGQTKRTQGTRKSDIPPAKAVPDPQEK